MPRRTGPPGNNSVGALSRLLLRTSTLFESPAARLARWSVLEFCDIGFVCFETWMSRGEERRGEESSDRTYRLRQLFLAKTLSEDSMPKPDTKTTFKSAGDAGRLQLLGREVQCRSMLFMRFLK